MRKLTFILTLLFFAFTLGSQVNPENVTIVRDKWGVPHIYGKTDAEVVYGLAWATAEDDFRTFQKQFLPFRGLSGLSFGKEGAVMDVLVHLIQAKEVVEKKYETDVSPKFKTILEAYAAGINTYAQTHSSEVLNDKLFPIAPKDILQEYVLGMVLMSSIHLDLAKIIQGQLTDMDDLPRGSNAFAVNGNRTVDGKTYLAINAHLPLEGLNSWKEVHLCSEEGWNMLGGTFPGGVTVFHGTNEHLGWAHTVNHPDYSDIYKLRMHPTRKLHYYFDGKLEKLESYPIKTHIKLFNVLKIGKKLQYYKSKYGITFKTKQGFFALRFAANRDIRAAEQWYEMNKASNFEEFKAALSMNGITCTNIVYADRKGQIYYLANGRFPKRNEAYNWKGILPGDTSATLWADDYYPIDSLVQVLNPASNFVYNCNHTPFLSTGASDNPLPHKIPSTIGYLPPDYLNNRAIRLFQLQNEKQQMDYEFFKRIKFDRAYNTPLQSTPKLEAIFHLDTQKYPSITQSLALLKNWDRVADEDSPGASIFVLAINYLLADLGGEKYFRSGDLLTEKRLVKALQYAQNHLKKHFKQVIVPLGKLQRHSRGNINIPMGGAPDVLATILSRPQKNGELRPLAGESYIQLVKYSKAGVEIESINAFGSSAKKGTDHYTDQMEWYSQQKLKPMTLDRVTIFNNAKRIYHPGQADLPLPEKEEVVPLAKLKEE